MLGFKLFMHFFHVCIPEMSFPIPSERHPLWISSDWTSKPLFLSGFLQTEPQNLSFSKTIDLPCFLLSHGCFPIVSPCTVSVYARLVHCLCCTCACSPCVRMHECGLRIVLLNQIWGIVDTFIVIVILQARHKIWGIVDSFIIVVLL